MPRLFPFPGALFVLTLAQPACLRAADPAGGTVDPSTVNRRFLFNEQPGSDNTTDVYTTDIANRLAVDASGNVTLACTTTRPAYSSEGGLYSYDTPIAFVKFDASSTVLWRNYSTSGNIPSLGNADFNLIQSFRGLADGWTVAVVTNGSAGSVQGIATVIRLDASGGVVFASAYGIGDSFANNFRSTPVSISPDAAGNVYVTGVHAKGASNYYTNDGVSQQLVLRYDANPALVWSILGPNEADTSRSVSGPVSLAGLRLGAGGIPSVATANTSSRATPRSPMGARNRPRRWRWACTSPTSPDFSFPAVADDPSISQVAVYLDTSNPLSPRRPLTPAGGTALTAILPITLAKKGDPFSTLGPLPFKLKIAAKRVNAAAS